MGMGMDGDGWGCGFYCGWTRVASSSICTRQDQTRPDSQTKTRRSAPRSPPSRTAQNEQKSPRIRFRLTQTRRCPFPPPPPPPTSMTLFPNNRVSNDAHFRLVFIQSQACP
ncbi:hypothetical protein VFPPC_17629 [Pochonia chlamydosporia 170]|uniref:Uncharacterized protein n=1 Tax=Pochonia chlamydosporia 170 TaxID=1380566 RepID=A0A219ASK3_METCM|nr:hypothetical protein VFPPC_17629 [Pochonia chlamydosporia 170]OWT43195.1 hypothetical protein VFPPC_17629 [Pochonia chlamydosporia 170]